MSLLMRLAPVVLLAACTTPPQEPAQTPQATASWEEGAFEYVTPLRGQGINAGGGFVYMYGPADGSGPMTAQAGTYLVSGDTVTSTVTYSTNPEEVGRIFRWTAQFLQGDTMAYVVMDLEGRVTGRGRSVRIR